jgi:hypothetical protein
MRIKRFLLLLCSVLLLVGSSSSIMDVAEARWGAEPIFEEETQQESNVEISLVEDLATGEIIIDPPVLERTIYLGDDDETGTITIHNLRDEVTEFSFTVLNDEFEPLVLPSKMNADTNHHKSNLNQQNYAIEETGDLNVRRFQLGMASDLLINQESSEAFGLGRFGVLWHIPNIREPEVVNNLGSTGLGMVPGGSCFMYDDYTTLYALDGNNLYSVDIETSMATLIREQIEVPEGTSLAGITCAYNFFYAVAGRQDPPVSYLLKVDKSGNSQLINKITGTEDLQLWDIEYIPETDTLIGLDRTHLNLVKINPMNGDYEKIGPLGVNMPVPSSKLAYDQTEKILYMTNAYRFFYVRLMELSMITGRGEYVGGFPGSFNWIMPIAIASYNGIANNAVPWLTFYDTFADIPPGESFAMDVTFSAKDFTQPGDYKAELRIMTGIEYDFITIPVVMHVVRPYNWGSIKGTVQGLERCDINPSPLSDAVIEIYEGEELVATTKTDENGYFSHAIKSGEYRVGIRADGFVSSPLESIFLGISEDFVIDKMLRRDESCIIIEPSLLKKQVTQIGSDMVSTLEMKLINTGAKESIIEIIEKDGTVSDAINLLLDDGTMENAVGLTDGGEIIWANHFTLPDESFPFVLEEVQIAWYNTVSVEDRITIAIYSVPDGNPEDSAVFLGKQEEAVLNRDGSFVSYLLREPVVFTEPTDILIAVVNRDGRPGYNDFPGAIDLNSNQMRSWFGASYDAIPEIPIIPPDNGVWHLVGTGNPSLAGNWLIRGKGSTDEGDIVWLSLEPTAGVVPADGGELDVNLQFDPTGMDLGTYQGRLVFNDWPYPRRIVPVEMEIVPPTSIYLPLIIHPFLMVN